MKDLAVIPENPNFTSGATTIDDLHKRMVDTRCYSLQYIVDQAQCNGQVLSHLQSSMLIDVLDGAEWHAKSKVIIDELPWKLVLGRFGGSEGSPVKDVLSMGPGMAYHIDSRVIRINIINTLGKGPDRSWLMPCIDTMKVL